MTGQVKEDILSRFGELGVFIKNGKLYFNPCLLRKNEFLIESKVFDYVAINSEKKQIQLDKKSLCFTYCQVPIVYTISAEESLKVTFKDGGTKLFENLSLDTNTSENVFNRSGEVIQINVDIKGSHLR